MIPTNYSATNTYYGYSIEWKMKRRVIADLRNLYSSLYNHYKDTDVKINTVYGKGYMILGVFLHLVQDLQAHRATITADMIFETYDSTSCDKSVFYNYDNCVDSKKDSRVNGKSFIKGEKAKYELYNKVKKYGGIPIIRLKDYLIKKGFMFCNGCWHYDISIREMYEDNPYFWKDRMTTAKDFSVEYINRMNSDTKSTSPYNMVYYANKSVPIYPVAMEEWSVNL